MKKAYLRAKIILKSLQLARSPGRTDLVFDIADGLFRLGAFQTAVEQIRAEPSGQEWLKSKKLLNTIDLKELLTRPQGSLGRVYAEHMVQNGLDPYFYRERDLSDDLSYIVMGLRQSHDLWHIVTGFRTDVPGEIALQAFMMSYLRLPLSVMLVGGSLIRVVLTEPGQIARMVDAITDGVTLGKKCHALFAFDWEANWSTPLGEVREQIGLV